MPSPGLAPRACDISDPANLVRLAKTAFDAQPTAEKPNALNTLGASLYRACGGDPAAG